MCLAWPQSKEPNILIPSPVIMTFFLPSRSEIIPAGSSMSILDRNQADTTRPTRTPEGSKLLASIGRKEDDRLIEIIILAPMIRSS